MNKKWMMFGLCFAALLQSDVVATPISVSVAGTANETKMGYTQGESYTFTWVVNDGYTGSLRHWGDSDTFTDDLNQWFSNSTGDPSLWESVFGDGLGGSYHQCAYPRDLISVNGSGIKLMTQVEILTENFSIGLLIDGVEAWTIGAAYLQIPNIDYSDTSFVNPATYLKQYVGSYATGGEIYLDSQDGAAIGFTATSVTIGTVPEPSTFLLLGLGGLGAWILRKNRLENEEDRK